jgi:regulator of sirC expression with transglutaminase-like and TPR domain
LTKEEPPGEKFELAVSVKLGEESGAAGLAFASDGNVRHYGFYPTNGRMRLTRFDGSDVYSWTVIGEKPSDAYRAGDWNRLKVRVEKETVRCYVNNELVFEHEMNHPEGIRVGLAKFRETQAEFKEFALAEKIVEPTPSKKLAEQIAKLESSLPRVGAASPSLVEPLAGESAGALLLRNRAQRLEYEAEQLRMLADALHRRRTVEDLKTLFAKPDRDVDLLRASLLIARLDNEEIDVAAYVSAVDRMADEIRGRLKKGADERATLAALNKYLYQESGFHGSRRDYYSRSNSYLNEVIDDREGLPITLSVLYVEIGRRLGLSLAGVGLPGHFLAALVSDDNQIRQYIDPFTEGASMTEEQVTARAMEITGRAPDYEQLQPVTKRAVAIRILENLLNVAVEEKAKPRMAGYLDAILTLAPEHLERRMMRAMLRYQTGMINEALVDIDYVLEKHRDEVDEERVLELRERLEREKRNDE